MSRLRQVVPLSTTVLPRLEALPQPVVAHRRDLAANDVIPAHHHRRAQLIYATRGVMTVTAQGGAYVVPPHRGVWMPGGVEHVVEARSALSIRTLYIEPEAAPDLPARVAVLQVPPLLRELIVALAEGEQAYAPGSPENRMAGVMLDQLRLLPAAPLSLPIPSEPRIRKVADGLIENAADPRTPSEWARAAGISERTLTRLFPAHTGLSFRAWRQQRRLLRALELLAGGMPVTTVALELGYGSPSAFTAMFRRALGSTPSDYFAKEE